MIYSNTCTPQLLCTLRLSQSKHCNFIKRTHTMYRVTPNFRGAEFLRFGHTEHFSEINFTDQGCFVYTCIQRNISRAYLSQSEANPQKPQTLWASKIWCYTVCYEPLVQHTCLVIAHSSDPTSGHCTLRCLHPPPPPPPPPLPGCEPKVPRSPPPSLPSPPAVGGALGVPDGPELRQNVCIYRYHTHY